MFENETETTPEITPEITDISEEKELSYDVEIVPTPEVTPEQGENELPEDTEEATEGVADDVEISEPVTISCSCDTDFEIDYERLETLVNESLAANRDMSIMDKPLTDYTVTEGLLVLIFILELLQIVWNYNRKDI